MSSAISQYLTMGIGVAISPLALIAIIVLCVIGRDKTSGTMFILGWMASIILFMSVAVALGIGANAGSTDKPSFWSILLQFAFAFLLLFLAWRNWSTRPAKGAEIQEPKWISKLHSMSPMGAFLLAMIINLTNAKNLPIMGSVAIILAQTHQSWGSGLLDATLFALIASLGVIIPWLISILGGDKMKSVLENMRDWLYKYNNIIMTILFGFLGLNALSHAIGLIT